jgi:hypothetical protein
VSIGVDRRRIVCESEAQAETGRQELAPTAERYGAFSCLDPSAFTPPVDYAVDVANYPERSMTEKSRQLAQALSHLDQCNRDLRSVMQRFESTTSRLSRQVGGGALVVEAVRDVTGTVRLNELGEAAKAFEVARHRARVAVFALAIEQGTNLSEMGRALGISRQLASRVGAEAQSLRPT